jgi:polysaccharide pyruvyl transferase WcaK-like protein
MIVPMLRKLIRPKKRIGYIGWVGHQNLGDEALFAAFQKTFPQFDIAAIPFNLIQKMTMWKKVTSISQYAAVALGGGTLVAEGYLNLFRNAQKFANYSFLFGTGVENDSFWRKFNRIWELADWKTTLKETDYIGVRGPYSQALLKKIGIYAEILGDLALVLSYEKFLSKKKNKHILVNLGTSRNYVFGNESEIFDICHRLINKLTKDNWKITLVFVWPNDEEVVTNLYNKIAGHKHNNIFIHKEVPSFKEYFTLTEKVDLVLGFKLHAVVLAHCTGTPAIMLGYREKCFDYMDSMGLHRFCNRTDHLEAEILYDQINEVYENQQHHQDHLSYWTNYYKQKILSKGREISDEIFKKYY